MRSSIFPPARSWTSSGILDRPRHAGRATRAKRSVLRQGAVRDLATRRRTTPTFENWQLSEGRAVSTDPVLVHVMMPSGGRTIKKDFPLRGSMTQRPPYLHDGRLLTLETTLSSSHLVLGTRLTPDEKRTSSSSAALYARPRLQSLSTTDSPTSLPPPDPTWLAATGTTTTFDYAG